MGERDRLCTLPEVLVVLCALAAGALGIQQHTFHRTTDRDDLLPSSDPLFHEADISDMDCARVCDQHPDCLVFTFVGGQEGSCYGYLSSVTSQIVNGTAVRGASTCDMIYTTGPKQCPALVKSAQLGGVIQLSLDPREFCDGRWLVFQRRQNGLVDFYRDWEAYRNGFGDEGEFWLGLEAVRQLTSQGRWNLRVDMRDRDGNSAYATYSNFRLGSEDSFYRLMYDSYTGGTADNSLGAKHRGKPFSTRDRDHDTSTPLHCAVHYHGAWWYGSCHDSNLNGHYNNDNHGRGLNWKSWRGHSYSLSFTEMKIQKV